MHKLILIHFSQPANQQPEFFLRWALLLGPILQQTMGSIIDAWKVCPCWVDLMVAHTQNSDSKIHELTVVGDIFGQFQHVCISKTWQSEERCCEKLEVMHQDLTTLEFWGTQFKATGFAMFIHFINNLGHQFNLPGSVSLPGSDSMSNILTCSVRNIPISRVATLRNIFPMLSWNMFWSNRDIKFSKQRAI